METIQEGKTHLRENFEKGTECPCCGQFVKLYKRKFGSVMARTLIRLYNMPTTYNHVKDIVKGISDTGTNDFSKMKYWGLIEEMPNDDSGKKNSGYWMITEKGEKFALGQISIPSHAFVYNSMLQGFSNTQTNIIQALGKKFDYAELMRGE
jgi:hypothetical protein